MRLPALSKIVVGSHPNTNADALPEGFLEELRTNPTNKFNTWQVSITFSIKYIIVPVNSNLFKQGIVHSIEHDKLMQNVQNHYSSWIADGGFFLMAFRMTDCDEKGQGGEKLGLKICQTKLGAPVKGFETFDLMDLVGLEVFDTLFGAMFTFKTHGKYGDYGSPGLARELLADSKQFEQLFDSKTRCRIPTNATCFAPPGIPRTALNRLDATTCLFSYVCYAPGFRGVELSRTMTLGQIQRVFIVDGLRANLLQGMSFEQAKVSFREFWRANYMQIGQGSEVFEAASNAPLDAFLIDPVNFRYPPFEKKEKKKRKRRNDDRTIVIDDDVDAEFDNSANARPPPRQRRRTNVPSAQATTQARTATAQTGVNAPPASSSSSTQAAQPNAPAPGVTINFNITMQAAPQGVQSLMAQALPQVYQNSQAATAASLLQAFLPSASTAFGALPVATTPPVNTVASYIQQQQNSLGIQALGQLGLLGQGFLGQGSLGQGILGQGMLGQGVLGQGILGQGMLGQDWSNKAPYQVVAAPSADSRVVEQSKPPKKQAKKRVYMAHYAREIDKLNQISTNGNANLATSADDRQAVAAPSADSRQNASRLRHIAPPGAVEPSNRTFVTPSPNSSLRQPLTWSTFDEEMIYTPSEVITVLLALRHNIELYEESCGKVITVSCLANATAPHAFNVQKNTSGDYKFLTSLQFEESGDSSAKLACQFRSSVVEAYFADYSAVEIRKMSRADKEGTQKIVHECTTKLLADYSALGYVQMKLRLNSASFAEKSAQVSDIDWMNDVKDPIMWVLGRNAKSNK